MINEDRVQQEIEKSYGFSDEDIIIIINFVNLFKRVKDTRIIRSLCKDILEEPERVFTGADLRNIYEEMEKKIEV